MRSFRFLLSRRWALFALAVVLLAYAAWWLGEWQFGRLDDRKAANEIIRTNEAQDPAPVDRGALARARTVDPDDEWRLVTATGTYATDKTVIVRYRNRDGAPGVDVVVPLVTADGTALVVDRGFLGTDTRDRLADDVPQPPDGPGHRDRLGPRRRHGRQHRGRRPLDARHLSTADRRRDRPARLRRVHRLRAEDPGTGHRAERVELPELDNGPHFFYGLQWWFFGVLAVFGFGYLAYDERNVARAVERRPPTQEGAAAPDVAPRCRRPSAAQKEQQAEKDRQQA